ncbi:MAG: hypothetical protein GY720_16750 [bacterium]|nr:hypothetical protein [bacterium]
MERRLVSAANILATSSALSVRAFADATAAELADAAIPALSESLSEDGSPFRVIPSEP